MMKKKVNLKRERKKNETTNPANKNEKQRKIVQRK